MKLSFSTALVTGATGFLGYSLVNKLLDYDIEVTCLVRKPFEKNINKRIRYLPIDIYNQENINILLGDYNPEIVFHLAAYGVNPICVDPSQMFHGNLDASSSLLLALTEKSVKRIIYAGTCSEYGGGNPLTYFSEESPLTPTCFYGSAKAATEIYCAGLAKKLGQEFVTLRLFNIFGPGEQDTRLVPYLINQLLKNKPVDLTPGKQVRDYLYIDDVTSAFIAAANTALPEKVYNICSSHPVTIYDIACQIAKKLNVSKDLLNFGARSYRTNEPMWLVGDNSKFCRDTTWQPSVDIEYGISKMVKYLTKQ